MDPARISTLLDPFLLYPLPSGQLERISTYIDLLLRWNARTSLTAIRTPDEIVTRHFGESLFAAQTLFPLNANKELVIPAEGRNLLPAGIGQSQAGGRDLDGRDWSQPPAVPAAPTLDLLDLGSGAGFPGIPIHLWAPHLRTTLIESNQKKVAFLREVIRSLTLTNINVSPARAKDFPTTARAVTLRAVERFDQILPTAAQLVAPGGRLALLIAGAQAAAARAALPHFSWHAPIPIPESAARILLVGTI
jgi:16S rRNA (guanine527-N7)-methyltransferase